MKNRFLLAVSIILLVFSCNQFVNLGDKSYDGADNTEGLPDEISEDGRNSDSADGNYDDWNEDSADTEHYEESGSDNGEYSDEKNEPYPDEDFSDTDAMDPESEPTDTEQGEPHEYPDETEPSYVFPESDPFPEGFSNAECGCGEDPQYEPVCCNGVISVFNSCFANCYAVNSSNKICTVYNYGLCADSENSGDDTGETPEEDSEANDQDDEITDDNDDELPDSDEDSAVISDGCGCSPEEETAIFRCGEHFYVITSCLANCLCSDPEKLFL